MVPETPANAQRPVRAVDPGSRGIAPIRPGVRTVAVVAGLLTAVWIVGAVLVGIRVFGALHLGLASCLPSDFPKYPRASLASVVVSDSYGDCTMQYRTPDSAADVQDFFRSHLDQGDWTVSGADDQAGLIRFQRVSRPRTLGYVKVISFPGQQTQFQIQLRNR